MILCRACLSSDTDLFQPSESFICNYNLLTNLNVKAFDGKPQRFCRPCMDAVNFFIDFRNKCALAESNLQGVCTEQIIKSEKQEDGTEFVIKGEIKSEDAEFDSAVQFDEEANDYTLDIKTQKSDGINLKKSRRKLKKEKPCKKSKKIVPLKDTPSVAPYEIYKKLNTVKPTCGLCGQIFDDGTSLNLHVEGHKTDKSCKFCPHLRFEGWPQLLAHRILHTVNSKFCHMCNKKCTTHFSLEYHYRKVHCEENDIKLTCEQCPRSFSTPIRLSKHIYANHSKHEFICDICSKVYNNKQLLKSHIISHGDAKRFACRLCGYRCKYSGGLTDHTIRAHTPKSKKITCKKCARVFVDAGKFEKHGCTDRSKICPICGKQFQRWFDRHMQVHRDEKPYKCPRCPSAYSSSLGLQVHMDKHDNNPRRQCEYCQRRFYSASVLIKHRRTHTGEKPYACTKCNMRFTGNHNLKVHMKVHGEMLIVKKGSTTK